MVLAPAFVNTGYSTLVLSWVCLNCVMAASMRFVMLTGHVNFAYGGFVGIGAYTSALLVMRAGLPLCFAVLIAGIVCAIVALGFGLPTLKLKGAYFFMASFGFAEVIRIIFHYFFIDLFGGVDGITGIPYPGSVLGISFDPKRGWGYYYLILLICSLSLWVLYQLEHNTRLGKILMSIQQSESLAESVGITPMTYKVMGFIIGSFFAGVTGSLYSHLIGVIAPEDFTFMFSVYILMYVVIGGKGNFFGPPVGAAFLTFISSFWLKALGFWESVAFAVVMLITILFLPEGLAMLPARISSLLHGIRKTIIEDGENGTT